MYNTLIDRKIYRRNCKQFKVDPLSEEEGYLLYQKLQKRISVYREIYVFPITRKKFFAGYVYEGQFFKLSPRELAQCGYPSPGRYTKDGDYWVYFNHNSSWGEFVCDLSDFFFGDRISLRSFPSY